MKTWLAIAACLLATFLVSDRSFVSGADLQGFEAEEEMSLRALPDDDDEDDYDYDEYDEEESDDDATERKRRNYGGGYGRPSFPGPSPPNGNIVRPVYPPTQPGYPQPPIGGGRPPFGKWCAGISRGSPHWVPGLDTWCPQNCQRGNCPSHLCVCY